MFIYSVYMNMICMQRVIHQACAHLFFSLIMQLLKTWFLEFLYIIKDRIFKFLRYFELLKEYSCIVEIHNSVFQIREQPPFLQKIILRVIFLKMLLVRIKIRTNGFWVTLYILIIKVTRQWVWKILTLWWFDNFNK